jgi:hypothetical protein
MRQQIVGIYECGWNSVEVVLRDGDGGEYFMIPEKGRGPRIKLGADQDTWQKLVAVLMHETLELVMDTLKHRYIAWQNMGNSHDGYLFMFDHPQFCDITARAAELMAACLPDLAKAWEKWKSEDPTLKLQKDEEHP